MNYFIVILSVLSVSRLLEQRIIKTNTIFVKDIQTIKVQRFIYLLGLFFLFYFLAFTNNHFIDREYGYINSYYSYSTIPWKYLLRPRIEMGIPFLIKISASIYDDPFLYFALVSAIICFSIYKFVICNFLNVFFGLFLITIFGIYFYAYNELSLMLSFSVILFASKYLLKGRVAIFYLYVFVASLFHFASISILLLSIPIFFIDIKKNILLSVLFSIILLVLTGGIVSLIVKYVPIYEGYDYRMNILLLNRTSVPLALGAFCLYFFKYNKPILFVNDSKVEDQRKIMTRKEMYTYKKITFNIVYIYILIIIMSLINANIFRISHFFSSFVILIMDRIIGRMEKKQAQFITSLIMLLFIIYFYVSFKNVRLTTIFSS